MPGNSNESLVIIPDKPMQKSGSKYQYNPYSAKLNYYNYNTIAVVKLICSILKQDQAKVQYLKSPVLPQKQPQLPQEEPHCGRSPVEGALSPQKQVEGQSASLKRNYK